MRCPVLCWLAVAALGATTAGCATQPAAGASARQAAALPGKPACFFLVNFRGDWTVLDDSTLIVHTPPGPTAYLVKLFRPVTGLRFHQALGFRDRAHTGQVCNNSQDELVFRGRDQPPVPITAVHQITPVEQARLLKAAGLSIPRDLQKTLSE
jgi:hypothetical protein